MSQGSWIVILVAALSAVSAVISAVIAARSALKAGLAESRARRLQELEERIAERKGELYQDIIKLLGVLLNPSLFSQGYSDTFEEKLREYSTWIFVYGSDDVASAYHNIVSGALSFPTPPLAILFRFYADFVLAVRRDLGYPDTKLHPDQVLDARSFKLYIDGLWPDLNMPLDKLYKTRNWRPPWLREPEPSNVRDAEAALAREAEAALAREAEAAIETADPRSPGTA